MIRKSKNKNSLSDKIADILSTAPATYDPEDDVHDETRAKVSEHQEESDTEELTSKFRKQNVELLEDVDERYVGKKASRNSFQDSDEWETEDEGLSTDEGEALDGVPGTRKLSSSEESVKSESDIEEDEDESFNDDKDISISKNDDDSNFKHIAATDISKQVKKGTCVRNQLNLWESLLEIRIQLQKCLVASNKLPQYDTYKEFKENTNFKSSVSKTRKSIANTLEKFLSLQLLLLEQYSETKTLMKGTRKAETDDEILSDTDVEEKSEVSESENEVPKKRKKMNEFEEEISSRHEKSQDYRNSVIQKWNEKTRLSTGKSTGVSNTILQQINFILQDKEKLIRRTQLKRSEYDVIGKTTDSNDHSEQENRSSSEYDKEIFDDDDFYHQLLRELIEFKSAGVTDPVQMSRQWIMLQKFRSKMKKKVDTKASKGRKVRYAIHSKLVNFMAPISNNLWTEKSKNELYSSLFGKNNVVISNT